MTPEQIARARELLATATPRPWRTTEDSPRPLGLCSEAAPDQSLLMIDADGMACVERDEDADLIAEAPTLLEAALAEIERLTCCYDQESGRLLRARQRIEQLGRRDRRFPVCCIGGRVGTIPWEVAEEAFIVYAARHGTSQSLERLAERGGFYPEELDQLRPGWRPVAARIEQLERDLAAALARPEP